MPVFPAVNASQVVPKVEVSMLMNYTTLPHRNEVLILYWTTTSPHTIKNCELETNETRNQSTKLHWQNQLLPKLTFILSNEKVIQSQIQRIRSKRLSIVLLVVLMLPNLITTPTRITLTPVRLAFMRAGFHLHSSLEIFCWWRNLEIIGMISTLSCY